MKARLMAIVTAFCVQAAFLAAQTEMIPVKAGTYTMGSPSSEPYSGGSWEVQHQVRSWARTPPISRETTTSPWSR